MVKDVIEAMEKSGFNNFKNVNCTYSIEYIYERDPFNSSNKDIKICLDLINTKGTFYYKFYNRSFAKKHQFSSNGIFTRLSACLRFYLLYTYGGIYLDCDTFPIKPFDEELLNNNYFISCRYIKSYNYLFFDNFFSGQIQTINNKIFHICKEYLTSELDYNVLYPLNERKIDYNLCKKFYNGTLKYGEYYGDPKFNYLDHYTLWNWNPDKCKIQETCIDKDIQSIKDHKIIYYK